jgi:hypothetical protein
MTRGRSIVVGAKVESRSLGGESPGNRQPADTWQGAFPHENLALDGYERTSPVTAFPPNGYATAAPPSRVMSWRRLMQRVI